MQIRGKLDNNVGQVNVSTFKETEEPSSSTVGEQSNNISTHESSFHNMEVHSTSLEDNQHNNMSIYNNETLKNNQSRRGKY